MVRQLPIEETRPPHQRLRIDDCGLRIGPGTPILFGTRIACRGGLAAVGSAAEAGECLTDRRGVWGVGEVASGSV